MAPSLRCKPRWLPLFGLWTLTLCLGPGARAADPPANPDPATNAAISALDNALVQEIKANGLRKPQDRVVYPPTALGDFERLKGAIVQQDWQEIPSLLETLDRNIPNVGTVQQACAELGRELQRARIAQQAAYHQTVDAAVDRAGGVLVKAKHAADLDPFLAELDHLRTTGAASEGPGVNRATSSLAVVVQTVHLWQNYLVALDAGRMAEARDDLHQLVGGTGATDAVIPRSELLSRLEALPDPNAQSSAEEVPLGQILDRLKTLADIAPVLHLLGPSRVYTSRDAAIQPLILELDALQSAYQEYLAGMPARLVLENNRQPVPGTEAILAALRTQYIRLVLPRVFGLSDPAGFPATEMMGDFLQRMIDEGKVKGDGTRILLAQAVRRLVSNFPISSSNDLSESQGFDAFFAAQNQEQAGQWELAYSSYEEALRAGGTDIPAAFIGQRLAAITREHSAEAAAWQRLRQGPTSSRRTYEPESSHIPDLRLPISLARPSAPAAVSPSPSPAPTPTPTASASPTP